MATKIYRKNELYTVTSVIFLHGRKTDHIIDGDYSIDDHTIDAGEYFNVNSYPLTGQF